MAQDFNCSICGKELINVNSIITYESNDDSKNYLDSSVGNITDMKLISKIEDQFSQQSDEAQVTMLNKDIIYNSSSEWTKGLHIDHFIPRSLSLYSKLGPNTPLYTLLNYRYNLNLVHSNCHKTKTRQDRTIIKMFRSFLKSELIRAGMDIKEAN